MTSLRLQHRTAVTMMKKINILCPSQTDIDDFTENYEATKGDLATCKNIFTRSKLRCAELKMEAIQAQAELKMEAIRAQAELKIEAMQVRLEQSEHREKVMTK